MKSHHRFWPARLPHAITTPDTSLWDNLDISARRFPNKTALIFLGTKLSYADLRARVETLAAHLQSLGVQKGDRVVLNMQNCPQLVIAHFAILRANAVVVPVNPMNRAEELKHYITDPDVRVARNLATLFNPTLYPGVGEMLRITQQELAYLVGLSRQRVNVALNRLEEQGAIRIEYGGMRVLNLAALRASGT